MPDDKKGAPRYRCPLCETRYFDMPRDQSCDWHPVKLVRVDRPSRGYLMQRRKAALASGEKDE